ncbi:hypothetical protein SNOG_06687 [Parastagonospora nodorum SN15]|uniref:Uncharacterized protein n=2 Tax=Phaeosphaeria nodorum (strain SN15 / ATCC MYA-4574 / FGSC 10173) TaxID=321614 RepID=Q0UNH7_PHANO|nr:hypothetical protein SNOG_06687 [Parastagonospora nodorum SN15]EAT86518.1 hypothetical protein SNOG_06687 [Parastagonospora nodorum SN15]
MVRIGGQLHGTSYREHRTNAQVIGVKSLLSYGTNWAMIATSHAPRRTTLSLKNRYNTLRLRHENINRTNAQDKIPLATITQPNKRHVQQPLEVQAQMVNNTWNDNAAPSRGCGEAASERNELSGENDSSEDEQRDVGLPAFGNPDHSKSSSRSATGSLLPPTPGSWLGMLDQDGPFSALFPSDEIYSMIPILDEDKAIQPFEQPFIPSDSPVCLATGSPSLGDQTGGARTCGLNETRGKSCFQPNSPSISRNHGVNQLSGGDLAENMSPTSAGQGLSTVASETQSAPALQQADTVGLGPSASGQDSASYLISVNLSCTDTQLERVMTALARTGAYVNVQIERALQ